MKTFNSVLFIAFGILVMVNNGCTPERPERPVQPLPSLHNTAPISKAGDDQYIFSPADFCILNGVAQDLENNIQTILWRNISATSSFLIEHPDRLSTRVSNLQIGVYQFELTVTDSLGLYGKDTIIVLVSQIPPGGGGGTSSTIAPKANAGPDKLVYFPTTFTNLYGGMSTWGNIIQTISWSKISGPSSVIIESPNSLGTKLSNLQIGVYQFELSVQDNAGLTNKDTCTVIVGQMSTTPSEVILTNQVWGAQGWGSAIDISNVYQYLPAGSVFRVYIKKDNSNNWEELAMDDPSSWYIFSLSDGDLHIFSYYEDESDTPDIKLVY